MKSSLKTKCLMGAALSTCLIVCGLVEARHPMDTQPIRTDEVSDFFPRASRTKPVGPVNFFDAFEAEEDAEDPELTSISCDSTTYTQAMLTNPLVLEDGKANPVYGAALNQGLLGLVDLCYEMSKSFGFGLALSENTSGLSSSERAELERIKRKKSASDRRISSLNADLATRGWTVAPFFGKTGYAEEGTHGSRDDLSGIVAARDGKLVVIPCGSKDSKDWEVNFTGQLVHANEVGLAIENDPLIHRGFGHMLASFQDSMKAAMDRLMPIAGEDANVFVSGHSQGAGVGAILSIVIAGE